MSLAGQLIRSDGVDLNVYVTGSGPSILLLHGFPDSNALWRHVIPELVAGGYRVIAPDLVGKRVAVAVNRDVVLRSHYREVELRDGDRIEILEAVGGG